MSADDVVTAILVTASIAGPALLVASRRVGRSDDPEAPPPRNALLALAGASLTFFGWILLALWIWLSTRHWGML